MKTGKLTYDDYLTSKIRGYKAVALDTKEPSNASWL
jgi:hypothetical protein